MVVNNLKSYIKIIFYPLEIVGRGSGTQFQVGKNILVEITNIC